MVFSIIKHPQNFFGLKLRHLILVMKDMCLCVCVCCNSVIAMWISLQLPNYRMQQIQILMKLSLFSEAMNHIRKVLGSV